MREGRASEVGEWQAHFAVQFSTCQCSVPVILEEAHRSSTRIQTCNCSPAGSSSAPAPTTASVHTYIQEFQGTLGQLVHRVISLPHTPYSESNPSHHQADQ